MIGPSKASNPRWARSYLRTTGSRVLSVANSLKRRQLCACAEVVAVLPKYPQELRLGLGLL